MQIQLGKGASIAKRTIRKVGYKSATLLCQIMYSSITQDIIVLKSEAFGFFLHFCLPAKAISVMPLFPFFNLPLNFNYVRANN